MKSPTDKEGTDINNSPFPQTTLDEVKRLLKENVKSMTDKEIKAKLTAYLKKGDMPKTT